MDGRGGWDHYGEEEIPVSSSAYWIKQKAAKERGADLSLPPFLVLRDRMRSLRFNLSKSDRTELRSGISSGTISPDRLSKMNSHDL